MECKSRVGHCTGPAGGHASQCVCRPPVYERRDLAKENLILKFRVSQFTQSELGSRSNQVSPDLNLSLWNSPWKQKLRIQAHKFWAGRNCRADLKPLSALLDKASPSMHSSVNPVAWSKRNDVCMPRFCCCFFQNIPMYEAPLAHVYVPRPCILP